MAAAWVLSVVLLPGQLFAQQSDSDFRIINPLETQPQEYEIRSISVSGTDEARHDFVINSSGLQEGGQITYPGGEEVSRAISQLHQTGLFSDIRIVRAGISGNEIDLRIEVEEQPRLESFEITGVGRSDRRELQDRIPLMRGFAVDESSKAQTVNTIRRYFEQEGYRDTRVEISETSRDTVHNRVTLEINIDEGERLQVGEIVFEGNDSFVERRLRREMGEIKENRWWRLTRQLYNDDDYQQARNNLLNWYRKNGYMNARVVDDSVYVYEKRPGRRAIGIHMQIEEGPQYHVRDINWDGNTIYDDEQLTQALGFESGDIFNQERFERNLHGNPQETDVTSLYHNNGYLFFRVEENIRSAPGDSVDMDLFITEDEIATVRKVEFSGNTKTHDNVVRRTLRHNPGEQFNRSAIQRSVRELAQLGYFNPEGIEPDLNPNFEDKTVDITYLLDESQSTDNFELSGGFGGRQIGLILSAQVNFNNFSAGNLFNAEAWRPLPSGDGQSLSLGIQVTGQGFQNYNFSFQEPWFLGRPNSLGVNLSYNIFSQGGRRRAMGGFMQRQTGEDIRQEMFSGSVSYGRRLDWPDDFFESRTRLRYQYFDVQGFTELLGGQANILSIREQVSRNSTDHPIAPRTGSEFTLSGEVAPPLPGFSQFYKARTEFTQYHPIVGSLIGSYGAQFGYMGWFSDRNQSHFDRFYLGGTEMQQRQVFTRDNIDMRGFPGGFDGSISPVEDGQEIGGQLYNKYFAEISYPAVENDQMQLIPYLFAEAGNAYLNFDRYDPYDVKRTAGVGAKIFMPILGMVDVSYGYRFDGLEDNPNVNAGEWQFLFNIGAPF